VWSFKKPSTAPDPFTSLSRPHTKVLPLAGIGRGRGYPDTRVRKIAVSLLVGPALMISKPERGLKSGFIAVAGSMIVRPGTGAAKKSANAERLETYHAWHGRPVSINIIGRTYWCFTISACLRTICCADPQSSDVIIPLHYSKCVVMLHCDARQTYNKSNSERPTGIAARSWESRKVAAISDSSPVDTLRMWYLSQQIIAVNKRLFSTWRVKFPGQDSPPVLKRRWRN
jgi:hypothetical protein